MAKVYKLTVRIEVELMNEWKEVLKAKGNLQQSYEVRRMIREDIKKFKG